MKSGKAGDMDHLVVQSTRAAASRASPCRETKLVDDELDPSSSSAVAMAESKLECERVGHPGAEEKQSALEMASKSRGTRRAARHASAAQLDGFLLLEASGAEYPDEATSARLVNKGLREVVREDLSYYSRLSSADFGENELSIQDLTNLHALEELRMPDNRIRSIDWSSPRPFPVLTVLDLSFNKLTTAAVGQLAALERLRELDLTCNGLSAMPENMCAFVNLELLMLNDNRIADPDSLRYISEAPKLRELDLSKNRVISFPENLDFAALEWLSLVGNAVTTHDDLAPLAEAPELLQVLLYDNPITSAGRRGPKVVTGSASLAGSTGPGRDAGPYPETVHDGLRADSRDVINVVTDAPHRDRAGAAVPRICGLYAGFKIAKVTELRMLNPREWKEHGRHLLEEHHQASTEVAGGPICDPEGLLGESEQDLIGEEPNERGDRDGGAHEGPQSVFLTEPSLLEQTHGDGGKHLHPHEQDRAGKDSYEVPHGIPDASELTTGSTTSQLRAQLDLFRIDEKDPILRRRPRKHNPAAVGSATSALRFALQHPLTAHTEDLTDEPEDEALLRLTRQTSSSKHKVKTGVQAARASGPPRVAKSSRLGATARTGIRPRPSRKDKQLMDSIETVLNRMDFSDAVSRQFKALEEPAVGGADGVEESDARAEDESDRAVSGLMTMVNQVMRDFA